MYYADQCTVTLCNDRNQKPEYYTEINICLKKKQFLNLDFCITCLNSESEWGAPCVPTQSVQVNSINSVGLQTYNTNTHTLKQD